MICSVLDFLDAASRRLITGSVSINSPTNFFRPFLLCVLSPEITIRRRAISVAQRLFNDHGEAFREVYNGRALDSITLRKDLWGRSSRVLISLCERIAAQTSDSALSTLHDCLKA